MSIIRKCSYIVNFDLGDRGVDPLPKSKCSCTLKTNYVKNVQTCFKSEISRDVVEPELQDPPILVNRSTRTEPYHVEYFGGSKPVFQFFYTF